MTALGHLQVLCALLDGHSAGHLAHGREQRQGAVFLLNRLVSDADCFTSYQRLGQLQVGRQVQVSEHDLARPNQIVLRRQRLLDMHNHVGPQVNLFASGDHLGTCGAVSRIIESAAQTGRLFHQHGVARLHQDFRARRRHAHAILFRLDLF